MIWTLEVRLLILGCLVVVWELKREEFEKKQMELVEFVREKFQLAFLESEYLKMREWVCNARAV